MNKVFYMKCPYCDNKAFTFKQKPYTGMKMSRDCIVEKMKPGEFIRCVSCDEIILNQYLTKKYLMEKDE